MSLNLIGMYYEMPLDLIGMIAVIALAVVIVGLLTVGGVLVIRDTIRRRGNWGLNLKPAVCTECDTPARWSASRPTGVRRCGAAGPAPSAASSWTSGASPSRDKPRRRNGRSSAPPTKPSVGNPGRGARRTNPRRERQDATRRCNVNHPAANLARLPLTRRDFLCRSGMGFASLGLANLMAGQGLVSAAPDAARSASPLAAKGPHFPGKAKRVIHLFMNGGPSHVDTFDPKPSLQKYAGKLLPRTNLRTERKTGAAFPSPFQFQRYGKSGIEVSELFPHTARCIDDICVIRSMHADVPNHEPSLHAHELRRGPADSAEHGLVGDLRPGQRESEPARLHRHVSGRLSRFRRRRTGSPPSCPASTRAPTSTRDTPTWRN